MLQPRKPTIPVVVERPELHGDGGHVLYMDGHVEFVSYPGRFPMVPSFIEGLRSLDALERWPLSLQIVSQACIV